MVSLAASPGFAALDVSPPTDTDAPPSRILNQALVWQRALLPGTSVVWALVRRPDMHARSSSAGTGRPENVHSMARAFANYLSTEDCVVEPDASDDADPATLAVLDEVPLRHPQRASALNVAESAQARPIPAHAPAPASQPSPVAEATPEPAPIAHTTTLDIREPDPKLAERFVRLRLTSAAALVVDQEGGNLLYAKNADVVRSIASITKLMTAMVALDAGLPLDERLTVQPADAKIAKGKESRLKLGVSLTRRDMLKLALMSSENRAAAALARTYPGGPAALVEAMNHKAQALGMFDTEFLDPTGLDARNVSTAHDLALMVNAAYGYPLIREFTTSDLHEVPTTNRYRSKAVTYYYNSNRLVRDSDWDVGLSKTGYIGKAGRCLVMQATIAAKPVIIVLLDSLGKVARAADANRIKHWLEGPELAMLRDKPRM